MPGRITDARLRRGMPFFFFAAMLLAFSACSAAERRAEPVRAEYVLGTICSITLFDEAKAGIYNEIFARLREIENRMSVKIEGSDVDRINDAAGIAPVRVHKDVFEVVAKAVYFAEISGGAFDPTVGPLVSLWGIGGENERVPSPEEIKNVLPLIDWRNIELNREDCSVFLKKPDMAIDLGAIAKGYAADEAAAILERTKVKRAIVNLGGNILTWGEKAGGTPWVIGIQDPLKGRDSYIGTARVREQTVVTSGVYERFIEENGIRYHHIFSSKDGYPVRNGLMSVTIIAGTSINADGLSTAVFALGFDEGKLLVESLDGVEAVFVFEDNSVIKTAGVDFALTDNEYHFADLFAGQP